MKQKTNHNTSKEGNNTIAIVNFKQACAYIGSGVKPLNLEYDWTHKVMVFYFDKIQSLEVWERWKNHEFQF